MSNYYTSYNYPYQQSSVQQGTQQNAGYQPASTSNTVPQPSRSHSQALPAVASLSTDYTSYSAQPYGGQGNGWSSAPDSHWGGSNSYSGSTDTSSRAAEALRDMSNTGYSTSNPLPAVQPSFSATNSTSSHPPRYSTNTPRSPSMQTQQPYTTSPFQYGQSQARPPSVNATRTQATAQRDPPQLVNQQHLQQRSESPAQRQQYQRRPPAPANSMKDSAVSGATTTQYSDHNHRQLPNVQTSRTTHDAAPSKSYNYPSTQASTRPPGPIPPSSLSGASAAPAGQSTTTVDPLAVYDPWPEYERKQEAIRAQRAAEEAARAAEEKRTKEAREEEERQMKQRQQEEERERVRAAQIAQSAAVRAPQQQTATTSAVEAHTDEAARLESEIRAMMVRMRELNGKDPALLARIWEEERKAKPKPSGTEKVTSPPAALSVQQSTPQPASRPPKNKAAPRAQPAATPASKLATPAPQAPVVRPPPPPQPAPVRPSGNTIWPSEQKTHLANAASKYLATNNPGRILSPDQILSMLDGNPSYIELCEQLESMQLKLDRAAFAKTLLAAAPDVNSASRKATAPQPTPKPVTKKVQAPPAVMKNAAPSPATFNGYAPAAAPVNPASYPPFPGSTSAPAAAVSPAPVAEAVLIKPEPEPPATKEEAARKRNMSDLVDLTQLDDDDDMGPPRKKPNTDHDYARYSPYGNGAMQTNAAPVANNFPSANVPAYQQPTLMPAQPIQVPQGELRYRSIVKPLDKKKALRRNTYNPATIARDVLLASGRHPSERQLNQHLDVLKVQLTQISNESDLSTIDWDLIDPGNPPPGYFKSSVQNLVEDADDEDASEDESRHAHRQTSAQTTGSHANEGAAHAIPEAVNPFKQKRPRGRPPRHSLPNSTTPASPKTPARESSVVSMSASAPRSTAAGVGYQAFRTATQYGPDGKPLPKKKGRPVGWRKALHGSAAAKGQASAQSPQTFGLREDPIRLDTRSPSVADPVPRNQSFKCKWDGCKAELHNLETLRLHLFKIHSKRTPHNTLDCWWDGCGQTNFDPDPNPSSSAGTDSTWRKHVQQNHIDPLSWKLGDGPASGLSDAYSSEAYLSDAQGRRVTPRITVDLKEHLVSQPSAPKPRGRGRPPKNSQEQDAQDTQDRLTSRKRRLGGPGMDRGGATLVNDKRRRGLVNSDWEEEELVDAED